MTNKMTDLQARVQRRVELSADLLSAVGIPQEVYLRVALNAAIINERIADCTPQSLDVAHIRCIQAGLLPDGRDAVIVPFKNEAQFIPMIEGQVKLAHKATPGLSLRTRVVYRDDEWDYSEGMYPNLTHVPNPDGSRTNQDIIAVYAIARLPRAVEPVFEVMVRGDIDRHRSYSRAGKGGPWDTFYGEMAQKTVLRKLLRSLPKPSTFTFETPADLVTVEYEGYGGVTSDGVIIDPEPVPPATGDEVTLEEPPPIVEVMPVDDSEPF